MNNSLHKQSAIPEWNLESLYPSLNSPVYEQACRDYSTCMDALDTLLAAVPEDNFADWLVQYQLQYNKTAALGESLSAYAYILYSTDTTNKQYLDNLSKMEAWDLRIIQQKQQLCKALAAHKDQLEPFYTKLAAFTPQAERYRFVLAQLLTRTEHQLSAQEENLAADLQRTGGNAWGRLQEQIISSLADKASGKTFNELRNDAYSADPQIRRQSYEAEISLLKENRIALAAALNNLKGETITLNKRRNWPQAIDRSLYASRMSSRSLQALLQAVRDSLPLWRQYLKTKAAVLKQHGATAQKTSSAGIAFYDLFAPLPDIQPAGKTTKDSLTNKIWQFDEARHYIIQEYASFSQEMGDFASRAFSSGWIDARIRPGKVGGAYCQDFPVQQESRILSNFTGTFSDIITLAHELGHAYHHFCIKDMDYALRSYPMTLAETASTFAETIVKQDAMRRSSGMDKARLLELDMQDVCQVLVDILCRFTFEQRVFDERKKGELTADDFCRFMLEAQEQTYGDGLNDVRHEYMWAVKSHYYSTSLDFYNFPYAFGQLFAAGLYARYQQEGSSFARTYTALLTDTGSMSCEDLCRKAGFDITTPDFWQSGIELYAKEAEELSQIVTA